MTWEEGRAYDSATVDDALTAEVLARLAALEDRRALDDLYYNYLWLLDNRRWQELGEEVFMVEATMDLGGDDLLRGRTEITDVLEAKMGALQATAHYYTNLVVELLTGGRARSRGYIQSWHWSSGAREAQLPPVDFICIGAFHDELVKVDERWWITSRRRSSLGPSPFGLGVLPVGLAIAGMRADGAT